MQHASRCGPFPEEPPPGGVSKEGAAQYEVCFGPYPFPFFQFDEERWRAGRWVTNLSKLAILIPTPDYFP